MSKFSKSPADAAHVACRVHGGREITVKIVLEKHRDQPFTDGARVVLTGPIPIPPLTSNHNAPPRHLPERRTKPVTSSPKGVARFQEVEAGRYAAQAFHPGWSFIPDGTVPNEISNLTLLAVEKDVTWGLDTNETGIDIAHAKQQRKGLAFIGRYLSLDAESHPMLSLGEAQLYAANDLDVVALYEKTPTRAIDGGTVAGARANAQADLDAAVGCLNACGGKGSVIYFTCDFPVSSSSWKKWGPLITAYFERLGDHFPVSRVGVYGSYTTLDHLFEAGLVQWGWQTIFGSPAGAIHPRANICQYDIYADTRGYFPQAGAGELDLDVAVTPKSFGGFRPT